MRVPAVSVSRWCAWHQGWVPADRAAEIGTDDEPGSGPPVMRTACWPCVDTHGLRVIGPTPRHPFTGHRALPPILPAPAPRSTT
jgi:hypothetical protein